LPTYAYIRVSTHQQDGDAQQDAVARFAQQHGLLPVCFVSETVSGTVPWKRRNIATILDNLQSGDALIVTELSRLGRSFYEIFEILALITGKGCKLFALKGGFELGDNLQSKVIAFAFSLAAEIERELISQRTKEALAYKKTRGKLPVRGKDRQPRKARSCK